MTEIARMYGGSLYDLAAEEGLETRILGELEEVNALFKANPTECREKGANRRIHMVMPEPAQPGTFTSGTFQ